MLRNLNIVCPKKWLSLVLSLACCAVSLTLTPSSVSGNWLKGGELERRLAQPVGITWSGQSLRNGLQTVQAEYRVAVLLDRRVDPSRKVELSVQDVALRDVLRRVAADQQLGLVWLGPVAYFGPVDTARRLRTLMELRKEEIRKLSASARQTLSRSRPAKWPELATPRDVLTEVAETYGFTIVNLDTIPHDLWPAGDLPAMAMAEQLTLLIAGFELTFRLDDTGTKLKLTPMPQKVTMDRLYPAAGRDPSELAMAYARTVPEAQVKAFRGQIAVRGRFEDHQRIDALRRGESVPAAEAPSDPRPPAKKKIYTYTINVSAPIGQLLGALERQAKFELKLDRRAIAAAEIDMEKIVKIDVKDVTLDELLDAALRPAGLQHRREGKQVEVYPRK